jgi:hypothetical protein
MFDRLALYNACMPGSLGSLKIHAHTHAAPVGLEDKNQVVAVRYEGGLSAGISERAVGGGV